VGTVGKGLVPFLPLRRRLGIREECSVNIKQRCRHLFTLLFLTGSVALGSWVWDKFSLPFQRGNQILTMPVVHVGATACPCPTSTPHPNVGATACPCPMDMNTGAYLLIPAIGLDAPIEPVGLLPNGALNVPQKNQWTDVGWYKDGPVPGQSGSAIIDGHLDRPGGAPAVFWNLQQLQRGDMVMVVGAQGQTLQFQVVQLQSYQPDVAPLEKIYGNTSGTYLNLITCAGPWLPSQHQTAERLVVYTKKV
jgi:LPXTG-site transpeptidase (sortase) family protein